MLEWSKLRAYVDDKSDVTQNIKGVFHRIENIVGKEENAGYHNVFKRLLPPGLKSRHCAVKS